MTSRTELNAMIAGFLNARGTITVCPDYVKAYPWATEQDWKDALQRHHVALELAGLVGQEDDTIDREANLVTGEEHSAVYAYYMGDDEDTSDVTDLDRHAYEQDIIAMTDAGLIGDCSAQAMYWAGEAA